MSANPKEMSFTKDLTFKEVFEQLKTAKGQTNNILEVKNTALYKGKRRAKLCSRSPCPLGGGPAIMSTSSSVRQWNHLNHTSVMNLKGKYTSLSSNKKRHYFSRDAQNS